MKAARLRALFLAAASALALAGAFTSPRAAIADEAALKDAMQAYAREPLRRRAGQAARVRRRATPGTTEVYALLRDRRREGAAAGPLPGRRARAADEVPARQGPAAGGRGPGHGRVDQGQGRRGRQRQGLRRPPPRRHGAAPAGELAVPHLYAYLGDADAAVGRERHVRVPATSATTPRWPLAEVLASDDAAVRAATPPRSSGKSGDPRAAAALKRLAETDADPDVKAAGRRRPRQGGRRRRSRRPTSTCARASATTRTTPRCSRASRARATCGAGKTARSSATRSPAYLYPYQLAEESAARRARRSIRATAPPARCSSARSSPRRSRATSSSRNGKTAARGPRPARSTSPRARASRPPPTRCARALAQRDWDVAVELGRRSSPPPTASEDLQGHPLGEALVAPERRVSLRRRDRRAADEPAAGRARERRQGRRPRRPRRLRARRAPGARDRRQRRGAHQARARARPQQVRLGRRGQRLGGRRARQVGAPTLDVIVVALGARRPGPHGPEQAPRVLARRHRRAARRRPHEGHEDRRAHRRDGRGPRRGREEVLPGQVRRQGLRASSPRRSSPPRPSRRSTPPPTRSSSTPTASAPTGSPSRPPRRSPRPTSPAPPST